MFRHDHELTTRDLIGLGFWAVLEELHHLERRIEHMAAGLTEVKADVSANHGLIQSAITLLNGLGQLIRDNLNDPAALADIATQLESDDAGLAQALADNPLPEETPAEPTPGANVGQVPVTPEVVDPTNLNNTPADADPSDPTAAGTAQPAPEPEPVADEPVVEPAPEA